jgi:hypothetical protein
VHRPTSESAWKAYDHALAAQVYDVTSQSGAASGPGSVRWPPLPGVLVSRRRPEDASGLRFRTTPRKHVEIGVRSGVAICHRLQEGDDLVFFPLVQAEAPDRHIHVVSHLGGRPTRHLFDLAWRSGAGAQRITRVLEVHHCLLALQVAVMHVCFHESGTRPQVRVADRRHLHLAVELRRERCPVRVRVGPGRATQQEPDAQIGAIRPRGIGSESKRICDMLEVEGVLRVFWQPEVGGGKVGEQWRQARGIGGRDPGLAVLGAVEVAGIALRFAAKQLIPALFWLRQGVGAGEIGIALRREHADVSRAFVGGDGQRVLIIGRIGAVALLPKTAAPAGVLQIRSTS